MNYFIKSKRLDHLIDLIKKGQGHTPKQLASKFECSEKTVRRMINCLRDWGYEIKYSRKKWEIFNKRFSRSKNVRVAILIAY